MEATGTVVRAGRNGFAVRLRQDPDTGRTTVAPCTIGGRIFDGRARGRSGGAAVVVGDEVEVEGIPADALRSGGGPPPLGRIARVLPRRNELRRAVGPAERREMRVFAANLDRFIIVSAFREPPYRTGFLDRSLVIAFDAGVTPALVFNKRDLADDADLERLRRDLDGYGRLDLESLLTSARRGDGIEDFRSCLGRGRSVLFGHSGVGKTELLTALGIPDRRRGGLDRRGRGRHTTTAAEAVPVPGGGEIVDTPGVRALGLDGLTPARVRAAHPDLRRYALACRFSGCSHGAEPGCAVKAAVAAGEVDPSRYRSLIRLAAEAADLSPEPAETRRRGTRSEAPAAASE